MIKLFLSLIALTSSMLMVGCSQENTLSSNPSQSEKTAYVGGGPAPGEIAMAKKQCRDFICLC